MTDPHFRSRSSRRGPKPGTFSTLQRKQISETKDAILRATVDILEHKPFDDITIEEILGRAPASRATFYRHFKSKLDLALALYGQAFDRVRDHFRRLPDIAGDRAAAIAWVERNLEYYNAEGKGSTLIAQLAATNERFHQQLRDDRQWLIEELGRGGNAFAQARGRSAPARRQRAKADMVLMLIERVCVEIAVHRALPDEQRYIELLAEQILTFLEPAKTDKT